MHIHAVTTGRGLKKLPTAKQSAADSVGQTCNSKTSISRTSTRPSGPCLHSKFLKVCLIGVHVSWTCLPCTEGLPISGLCISLYLHLALVQLDNTDTIEMTA